MSRLYLLSTSLIKKEAIESLNLVRKCDLICISPTGHLQMPPQPIGYDGGLQCANKRIELFKQRPPVEFDPSYDLIVSVENFIVPETRTDICCVVLELNGVTVFGYSNEMVNPIYPEEYESELGEICMYDELRGYGVTMGKILSCHSNDVDSNNWGPSRGYPQRSVQICNAYNSIDKAIFLKHFIRYVSDHPEPGVMFSDLSPLFANVILKNMVYDLMMSKIKEKIGDTPIDYVVGLDARGFIAGSVIAEKLGTGFVVIRKFGKLGGADCHSVKYGKEYGKDMFEIVGTIMKSNKNILIVDDVMATGGTFLGAKTLCDKFKVSTEGTELLNVKTYAVVLCDIEPYRQTAQEKLGDFYNNTIVCL